MEFNMSLKHNNFINIIDDIDNSIIINTNLCICKDTTSSNIFDSNTNSIIKEEVISENKIDNNILNENLQNNDIITKNLEISISEINKETNIEIDMDINDNEVNKETNNNEIDMYINDNNEINHNEINDNEINDNNEINLELNNYREISIDDINDYNYDNSSNIWIHNNPLKKNVNKMIEQNIQNDDLDSKQDQIDKLDLIFRKIIKKNSKKNINEEEEFNNKINKIYNSNDTMHILKMLSKEINNSIFIESTRGFNIKENINILKIEKLIENLTNFKFLKNDDYSIGFLYRDYLNEKIHNTQEKNTYWIEYLNSNNKTIKNNLPSTNKLLNACLKNFVQENKFKKVIGKYTIRAFKKTVEINTNKLCIDIIFFAKYKKSDTKL